MDNKRRKEQTRRQKQADKEARRVKRVTEKRDIPDATGGETDPDLAGMFPGPQPPLSDD